MLESSPRIKYTTSIFELLNPSSGIRFGKSLLNVLNNLRDSTLNCLSPRSISAEMFPWANKWLNPAEPPFLCLTCINFPSSVNKSQSSIGEVVLFDLTSLLSSKK